MEVNGSGTIALVFLECPECGAAIACKLDSGPPKSCEQHT